VNNSEIQQAAIERMSSEIEAQRVASADTFTYTGESIEIDLLVYSPIKLFVLSEQLTDIQLPVGFLEAFVFAECIVTDMRP